MDGGEGGRTPPQMGSWRWWFSSGLWSILLSSTPCLWRMGVDLYRVPFTEVARFDVNKAVAPDKTGDTGGLRLYARSFKLLVFLLVNAGLPGA